MDKLYMDGRPDMTYKKGDILTIDITDMGINGEGIGKTDGYTLFVKDAVIGDRVRVTIMKAKKGYAYAHLDEILLPSKDRVEPYCPKAKACGGCQLQALDYSAQLSYKYSKVRNDLIRIGGFDPEYTDSVLKPIVGMEEPVRYRGKAQFPVGRDKDGSIVTGFYAGHSHNIIPIDDCIIGAEEYAQITDIVTGHMRRYDIAPYDEASGIGLVRHILVRKGFATDELMVCLILNRGASSDGVYMTGQDELIKSLSSVKNMTSVSVNLNTSRGNVIMGKETHTIWGREYIEDRIMISSDMSNREITYEISPRSFYQVNPIQTEKLYSLALKYAGLTGSETVWDLYCGIGTISLFLAGAAGHVYGVEIVPEAIEDAKENAIRNGIDNADFYVGKAEDIAVVADVTDDSLESVIDLHSDTDKIILPKPDVIVVDPPRKGCDAALIDTMLQVAPERIVYVSCDPATLSRDLKLLCDGGYTLSEATPVDMFPHTVHVETVTLLSKLSEAKHHIEVKVDMDELDLTSAEAKATYNEIRDWVQEEYGFHVTNLNIAQVKQKHGIIERENYNKAKSVDSKQPRCPKDKVEAIEDAMRHFQMI